MNNIESQVKNLNRKEEPFVGMPILNLGRNMNYHRREMDRHDHDCDRHMRDPLAGMPVAMAYVPWQCWCETYEPAVAHDRGTIFPELDLPFLGGGGDC